MRQNYIDTSVQASTEKFFMYRKIFPYTPEMADYCYICRVIMYGTMYERKIPVDLDCPLRLTMSLIGSKWKSCILDELRYKPLRPSELHKLFPEAAPRVLDLQLKELVDDGLVSKTIFPELPPRSEYAITPLGATLIPIIDAMITWGTRNARLFSKKYSRTASPTR